MKIALKVSPPELVANIRECLQENATLATLLGVQIGSGQSSAASTLELTDPTRMSTLREAVTIDGKLTILGVQWVAAFPQHAELAERLGHDGRDIFTLYKSVGAPARCPFAAIDDTLRAALEIAERGVEGPPTSGSA